MGLISRLYNFVAGKRIVATQMNEELNQLVAGHNDHDTRIVTAEGKIVTLEDQVQAIADENIPPGSVTYSMLAMPIAGPLTIQPPGELGSTVNSIADFVAFQKEVGTANTIKLFQRARRVANGSDWRTVDVELLRVTDNVLQQRLIFGADGNMHINLPEAQKNLYIDGNGVFHQGFKPLETGTYTGDGAASRTISLGFTPSLVLVMMAQTSTRSAAETAIAYTGVPGSYTIGPQTTLSITTNGFVVYQGTEAATNKTGNAYNYVAFR